MPPSGLQDLADVLSDVLKAVAGTPLEFQISVTLGGGETHRRAPDRSERRIAPQSMTVAARADGLFVARPVQRSDRRRNDVPSATSGSLALRHNHVVCFNFAVTLPGLRNRDFDQLRVSPHGKQQ